jgi:hypothetical protein
MHSSSLFLIISWSSILLLESIRCQGLESPRASFHSLHLDIGYSGDVKVVPSQIEPRLTVWPSGTLRIITSSSKAAAFIVST